MKLDGEYLFNGPREASVETGARPGRAMPPRCPARKSLNKTQRYRVRGRDALEDRAHVRRALRASWCVSNEVPPESCTLTVEGKGGPGFVKGTGHVQLIEQPDGKTLMKYTGDLQVGGKLASTGQRMIETVTKSTIRQGLGDARQGIAGARGGPGRQPPGRVQTPDGEPSLRGQSPRIRARIFVNRRSSDGLVRRACGHCSRHHLA